MFDLISNIGRNKIKKVRSSKKLTSFYKDLLFLDQNKILLNKIIKQINLTDSYPYGLKQIIAIIINLIISIILDFLFIY